MRCFKCGRPLHGSEKPHYIDGKPIGPTCYKKLQIAKAAKSKAVKNEQPDLFKDLEK